MSTKVIMPLRISVGIILLLTFALTLVPACGNDDNEKAAGSLPVLHVGDTWNMQGIMEGIEYKTVVKVTGEDLTEGKECYVLNCCVLPFLA